MIPAASTDPWTYALAEFAEPEEGPIGAYAYRPADFARDFIRWPAGKSLIDYQADALDALVANHRLAVRGPHGLGKTTTEALAILWFAITREAMGWDWKIPTTAGVGRQLSVYLWPEVRKWARRLRWDALGIKPWKEGAELLDQGIKLAHGQAFAASVGDAGAIEGAHARSLLFVFTEAKLIDPDVFDAAEGAFSGAGADTDDEAFAFVQSTPGAPEGRFHDLCTHAPGTEDWSVRRVTKEQVMAAGRMSAEWAESRRRQWGQRSPVYLNRVEGEFASTEDGVIPLSWVEAANERWHEAGGAAAVYLPAYLGVDVGISGDLSVVASTGGDYVATPERLDLGNTTTPTTQVAGEVRRRMTWHPGGPKAVVDTDGIGAGVTDQLRQGERSDARVVAFKAGEGTKWRDRSGELEFANVRAAAWWNLREELDPDNGATLALPPDDLLTGDLTAPRWRYSRNGRIVIEAKDDLRKRIGRSTDSGDAVVMARWGFVVGRPVAVPKLTNGHRGQPMITAGILTEAF